MIYFIQTDCERGLIKIGTAHNFKQRLSQIQEYCPYPLKVLRTLMGDYAEEGRLHKRFAHARIRGEWFNATDDLMAYIADTAPLCLGATPAPETERGAELLAARAAKLAMKRRALNGGHSRD